MTDTMFNISLLVVVLGVFTFSGWYKYQGCRHIVAHK